MNRVGGKPHPSLATLQQGIVEEMSAAIQRARGGGLRQADPIGRARDMRFVEQRIQHDEQVEIDGTSVRPVKNSKITGRRRLENSRGRLARHQKTRRDSDRAGTILRK